MKSKKINKLKEKKTKKTKQKERGEKKEKEEAKKVEKEIKEEKETSEKRKKEKKEAEKAAVPEPVFDFQLQTVTEPAPVVPVPKTKEAKAKEFNLEDFLQSISFKDEKNKEKKYISKQDYSIARYVQDQEARKYTNTVREWREAIIAKGEHVKELFPKPSRRVKLRQEAFEAFETSTKEMETTISAQERLEYKYEIPFEKKIEREKRIKKYEIIK